MIVIDDVDVNVRSPRYIICPTRKTVVSKADCDSCPNKPVCDSMTIGAFQAPVRKYGHIIKIIRYGSDPKTGLQFALVQTDKDVKILLVRADDMKPFSVLRIFR